MLLQKSEFVANFALSGIKLRVANYLWNRPLAI